MVNTKTAKVKGTTAVPATTPTAPRITSFAPTSGPPGTVVTIVGQNFVNVQSVLFAGKLAGFVMISSEQIEASVPARAKSGAIIVRTKRGKAEGGGIFTVVSNSGREGPRRVPDPDHTK